MKLCESLFPLYKQSEMEELHILNKTQEFRPEIVIFVWCNSALAKYMAGVNIETFPICTFTVQIDKQASICTHQKELQKNHLVLLQFNLDFEIWTLSRENEFYAPRKLYTLQLNVIEYFFPAQ